MSGKFPTKRMLGLDTTGTLTLKHRANSVINKVEVLSERNDGLTITGTLTDIPTEVDFTLGLAGTATLNVNANTLDGQIVAEKDGGFLDTSDLPVANMTNLRVLLNRIENCVERKLLSREDFEAVTAAA